MLHRPIVSHTGLVAFVTVAAILTPTATQALLYTPVFVDSYAVTSITSGSSFNANLDFATRQSGAFAPASYVANTADVNNDFHHQVFAVATSASQPLQLAGDTSLLGLAPVLLSPNKNFTGLSGGEIVGKRITFSFNVGTGGTGGANKYLQGGITLGANSTLVQSETATPSFALRFVEDTFSGGTQYFAQFWDGNTIVGNLLAHGRGASGLAVQIDIDDPGDGNPWDGSGSTKIDVYVTNGTNPNGGFVGSYTKGGGGYVNNFLTLEGSREFVGNGLGVHIVDNLTVFSAVPESTAIAGLSSVLVGACVYRARKRLKSKELLRVAGR